MNQSRRELLKQSAVAGGVLWITPKLQSMTLGATGGTPRPCATAPCGNDAADSGCGQPFDQCRCFETLAGGSVCASVEGLGQLCVVSPCPPGLDCQTRCVFRPCSSTSPCPPGSVCVVDQCEASVGGICLPPCA
jgi:hypothetical protein